MKLSMMSLVMMPLPPAEIIRIAVSAGMTAIDWVTVHDTDPKLLRKMSEDAGLEIVTHTMLKTKFLERKPDYFDEFKASLEDAVALGAPVLMLPPFGRKNQASLEDDRKAWIEYYAKACPLAKAAGVQLTLESTGMPNSPIITVSEVLEVLHAVPGLRLTFDHGNIATAEDPAEAWKREKKYVVRFHFKDWKISGTPIPDGERKRCGKYFANAMIGDGDLRLREFWQSLDAKAKQIPVNLETVDFTKKLSPADAMKHVSDLMRSW